MQLQSDDKIVGLVGENDGATPQVGYLIRMDADGQQFDGTFGVGGLVSLTFGGAGGRAFGLGIQNVGGVERLVVAGWSRCGSATCTRVERYDLSGQLDPSFANSGVAIINSDKSPLWVTVLPDQRLLLTGQNGGMIRLTANGSPDPSFGTNGVSTATSVLTMVWGPAVVLSSGRFLIPGSSGKGNKFDLAVARFNLNGSLDSGARGDSTPGDSFGSSGLAKLHFSNTSCVGRALAVDGAGKIVVAGDRTNQPSFTVRFTSNGQLDNTYSVTGISSLPWTHYQSITLQNDGKAVVVGAADLVTDAVNDALVARYNTNGTIDNTFGGTGWVLKDSYGAADYSEAVSMQRDPSCVGCERILVLSSVYSPSPTSIQEVNFLRYLR
jgi:uncharacterized delta-60 repeat protein